MTNQRPLDRGASAGAMLLIPILFFAGGGVGLGVLVNAPIALGLTGLFIGLVAGFALVYSRFKDI